MSVTIQRLFLFFMATIVCCISVHAQLPCCQVQQPLSILSPLPGPQLVAFSPISNCLAIANAGNNSVALFTVDDTCTLTPAGTPATFATTITALAFSPTSNCLAVVTSGDEENPGTISLFTVDSDTCILNLDPISTQPVGFSPNGVAFSSNNCLAVSDSISGIFMFTVDPSDCSIAPVDDSPFSTGISPVSVAFSSDGSCLAIIGQGFNASFVSLFTVNPEDCSLSLSASSSLELSAIPLALAVSSNNCLAVIAFDNTVSMFTIGDDCSLTAVGSPLLLGALPTSVAFSSAGNCLAITTGNDEENPGAVSLFTVDPDCSLTQVQGSPIELPDDAEPTSVAYSANNCLAVASPSTNTVFTFSPLILQQPSITSAVVTNCPFITVTGTADPNVTIELFVEGDPTAVASGMTDDAGSFDIEVTSLLPGTYTIFAVASTLGCTSAPSSSVPVTIGLQQPIITSAEVTSCPFITVTGTADPNVSITLFADGDFDNAIGSGSTDGVGNFMITTTEVLSLGTHSIVAIATTPDGCTSEPSSAVEVTIDIPEPVITSALVTNCNTVTVIGTTGPNALVTLFVDGSPNSTGQSDDAGNFTVVTSPLSAGPHAIIAIAATAGCTSFPSDSVAATASAVPLITSVSFGCDNIVTVRGRSAPNTSVTLLADRLPIATGITNSEGTFIIIGAILPANTQCITVLDNSSGCTSAPACLTAPSAPCVIHAPNLAFGTHCNR